MDAPSRIEYETVPKEPYTTFSAMAQGKVDYLVDVIKSITPKYGVLMTICATEEAVYITKEQAMAFFDLVERKTT